MSKTKIEWADSTWNPVIGCRMVSAGCAHCYALSMARRIAGMTNRQPDLAKQYASTLDDSGNWNGKAVTIADRLVEPLSWRKSRLCFVCSMSDLFLQAVPNKFRAAVYGIMAIADRHVYQVLTKRPWSIAPFYRWASSTRRNQSKRFDGLPRPLATCLTYAQRLAGITIKAQDLDGLTWPLSNLWIGTTVENQAAANTRIEGLLSIEAAVRFLSIEPLLGPIDFGVVRRGMNCSDGKRRNYKLETISPGRPLIGIDWIIVGGESGPQARPMSAAWARSVRDQVARSTPRPALLFKQWGKWLPLDQTQPQGVAKGRRIVEVDGERFVAVPKTEAGRYLDGRTYNEYPRPPK